MSTATRWLLALVAAMSGGIVYARYRRELADRRHRVRAGGRLASTTAGPIEYAEAGSGPPALVIHGAGGGYDQGLFLGHDLAGFRVIAPSRFGYLGTPTPADLSPAAQADAHVALLDVLGVDRAVIAGVSAGAPSAVELALRHPDRVRALVLMVPRGYAPGRVEGTSARHEPAVMRVMMAGADFGYWAALRLARSKVVRFLGVPPELEARAAPAERERVTAILKSVLPLSLRVEGIRNDSAITLGPLPLERIRVPTLVISARDDLFETLPAAKHLAEHIPGAKLVVFESGGHFLLGRQDEVNVLIADFLVTSLQGKAELLPGGASAPVPPAGDGHDNGCGAER